MKNTPPVSGDLDTVLTGTTLKAYKLIVTNSRPIGPRELQKLLGLSTPSLALFHLEKLERNGLVSKSETGTYVINKVYLKHYVRVRRLLIPRYIFHSSIATFFLLGWFAVLFIPSFAAALSDHSFAVSSIVLFIYTYGLMVTVVLSSLFWFETIRVLRQEKI